VVLGGPSADLLIVSAAVGDDRQGRFALYLVDPRAPGVSMHHYPLIDYSRASDVRLQDVRVAPEAMLIGPNNAFAALEEATDLATLATVAEALGCMEAILQLTSGHLSTRVQFGQPLGKFQALQHRMAEMFIEVQETRSILYQGISNLDKGDAERRIAVSAAKAYAGNAGKLVGAHGIQLHGGIGVTEEARVGHYYKQLILLEKLFGDCDYHVNRFADGRL
jgi:alkylation response protein AidB-like acyl-CoA dehydrogenase